METKGEENVKAVQSFIPSIEVAFGHRESMSKVEGAIHIWIGKCLKELLFFIGLSYEKLVSFPNHPCPRFQRNEFVPSCGVFHVRKY